MIAIIIVLLGSRGSRGSLARRSCRGILVSIHHHTDSLPFGICHVLELAPPAVRAGAGLSEVLAVTGLELGEGPLLAMALAVSAGIAAWVANSLYDRPVRRWLSGRAERAKSFEAVREQG